MKTWTQRIFALIASIFCMLSWAGSSFAAASPTSGGLEIGPGDYALAKNFSAAFCEAIEDGVSVKSAVDIALPSALVKSLGGLFTQGFLNSDKERQEDSTGSDNEKIKLLALKKTEKCIDAAQRKELADLLSQYLDPPTPPTPPSDPET